ncbi:MAG: DUF5117 domain-containing protein [Bacteroidales bacterium]|nr:DUF5117 domain-containing protein [Bacteroidales bacterium]
MLKNTITFLLAFCISFGCATDMLAQKKKGKKAMPVQTTQVKKDSTAKKAPAPKGPVSLAKFVKPSAKIMRGMTTVYQQDNKYYININDTLLGRDIRMVSRISKGAEGIRTDFTGYAGDDINSAVFRFEKGPNNKIFMRTITFRERSNEILPENVEASNVTAIAFSFDIKAQSSDKKDNIIDVTDLLLTDTEYIFFRKRDKSTYKLGGLQKDKSYIKSVKTFPINTEFRVVHTYAKQNGNPTATFELNSSFVLLPKVPMTPRYADSRVGYFTVNYTDFDRHPQRVERTALITRWRLEPKPEDMEKYKRGELVEPAKPIVFYIDPTTPKEWVPYLIQGVNDWQPAFEKAGFKNAIYALEAPTFEEDSTWSLEDARHSAIVYKPSSTPNASGPHINDPRSGEIIESHVNWYHNVMSLLHKWYFIQCSPSDPAARKMTLDTELMGELIRFVSSHEVGHTLGLRHNFLASAIYTPEQLRDVEFLKENGHATSIMDYARFNYVAQPGDNIPRELLFPRINHYDNWAIEWGYRRFPEIDDPEKELTKINQWVIEKIKNPLYQFGTESSQSDPRLQSEDLGNNHMVSNEYGIKNLKYIMNNLIEWTSIPNQDYETLKDYYGEVLKQYRRYINHVARWIGGVYEEPKTVEQAGAVYTHVEKSKQKEAWDFLKRHFFSPQTWIIPDEVLNKIVTRGDLTMSTTYSAVLKNMMSKRVMMNLCNDELVNGSKGYTMENFYADMNAAVWTPLSSDKAKAMCQRILQKCYVKSLIDLYEGNSDMARLMGGNAAKNDNSDIISMAYYQLVTLKSKLNAMGGSATNVAHYKFLSSLIDKSLSKNGNNSK